ncbi:MAG: O-antigen ligase family protein [Patescibacteria group bacterium]
MKTNISQKLLDISLLAILAVVPLIFSTNLYNSFRLLKTVAFITLASLALIFGIWVFIEKNIYFWKKYKWLLIILGAFFIFKLISLFLSINGYISFWGGYSKLEGFLTWFFYLVYFLLLSFNIIGSRKRKYFTLTMVIAMFILSIISCLQHFGAIGAEWTGGVEARPIGTLGNPLHLSALMMLTLPITLFTFYQFKNIGIRIFTAVTLVMQFFVLIFTQSRSSWATFAILFFILGFCYLYKTAKNKKWLILFSTSAIVLIGSFITIAKINPNLIANQYLSRALSVFDSHDLSNMQRIYFWQGSWDAFLKKPLFGWGEDNLNLAFDRNYPPQLSDLPETRIDRAHNVFLDVMVEEGVFVLICLLALLGYLLISSIKLFFTTKETEKNWLGFLGIWTVLGFSIQYFFMYPTISAYVIIFFVFSQVIMIKKFNLEQFEKIDSVGISKKYKLLITAPAIILFSVILIGGSIPRIRGNWLMTQSLRDPAKAEPLLTKAYQIWPDPHFQSRLGSLYLKNGFAQITRNDVAAENYFKKAQGLYLKDIEKFPDNYVSYLNLASVYNVFGAFEISDKYFQKAVNVCPTRHDIYWAWAENIVARGDFQQAETIYKRAIAIDPVVAKPYLELAIFYKKMGKLALADQYYNLAVKKGLLNQSKSAYIESPVGILSETTSKDLSADDKTR